jgi:putative DNA primase/helicase
MRMDANSFARSYGLDKLREEFDRAKPQGTETKDLRPPTFSDEALALRFADLHEGDLRYVALWGKWFAWDGKCWRSDDTKLAFDLARTVCREAAASCNERHIAVALASAKTVAAVERLAKADRRIAATADQWDRDIWLLNTQHGVVDLRTGQIRAHRPVDYMTRITSVGPGGDSRLWRKFLDRVTGGDDGLQAYLKRMFGYSLTGSTKEHALFFAYGTGANGKSVALTTMSGILGDYHTTAAIETFTASTTEQHPTDLASLRGARLVTAVETEEGRRWAESKIKTLTGGDRIKARFMRQDFFEFVPQLKLLIAGNHKPGLRAVDEAIRRRFNLIPFAVTIPLEERDNKLAEHLEAEWGGILAWAIEGCLEWQDRGLEPPQVVQAATAAYIENEDLMAAWLDEACERDQDAWETSTVLFCAWKMWAERAGEYAGTTKRFVQNLDARGFTWERRKVGRGFRGLRLKNPDNPDAYTRR